MLPVGPEIALAQPTDVVVYEPQDGLVRVLVAAYGSDGQPLSMWTDSPLERLFLMHSFDNDLWGLMSWSDGEAGVTLADLDHAERSAFVTGELARVRPSTRGAIEVAHTTAWSADRWARGAYHHFQVGQISRFARDMAWPWHRLHLAGEHTSIAAPGMEGAFESGERTAGEILAALSSASGL